MVGYRQAYKVTPVSLCEDDWTGEWDTHASWMTALSENSDRYLLISIGKCSNSNRSYRYLLRSNSSQINDDDHNDDDSDDRNDDDRDHERVNDDVAVE